MKNIALPLLLGCLVLLPSCTTSNFYLVRHAEKVDNSTDPDLSAIGIERAQALKDKLANQDIHLLYATKYRRTKQTLLPLAEALRLEVSEYDASGTFYFVEMLKQTKGKNAVVAGHSNTIPEMVLLLTSDTVYIGHDDYHQLFHIRKTRGVLGAKYKLSVLEYGGR